MTPRPARPWRMLAPLVIVVLLLVLWSAYWLVAITAAQTYSDRYREALAHRGLTLSCASESWGGYPFRFEFTCTKPQIRAEGRLAESGTLTAVAQAYYPLLVILLVDGPTRLSDGNGRTIDTTHGRAIASLRFRGKDLTRLSVEVPNLKVEGLLSAGLAQFHLRPAANGNLDLAVTAKTVTYTPVDQPPITINHAEAVSTLNLVERRIELQAAQLRQSQITLDAAGTAGLDGARRASGKINLKTNDLQALLAVAEPHLHLSDNARATLKPLLTLLGKTAQITLTAKDGELFLGPVKLRDLKPLY